MDWGGEGPGILGVCNLSFRCTIKNEELIYFNRMSLILEGISQVGFVLGTQALVFIFLCIAFEFFTSGPLFSGLKLILNFI